MQVGYIYYVKTFHTLPYVMYTTHEQICLWYIRVYYIIYVFCGKAYPY